jgi:hypothetical protein
MQFDQTARSLSADSNVDRLDTTVAPATQLMQVHRIVPSVSPNLNVQHVGNGQIATCPHYNSNDANP